MAGLRPLRAQWAIMFADITGSTELYERLGDRQARTEVCGRLERVAEAVAEHGGTVVKTIGDEVLCTYRTPEAAVHAAASMHRRLEQPAAVGSAELPPLGSMRIGLHCGPVIHDQGDIFGRAVNLAARMVSIAKAQQTLATRGFVEKLPATLRSGTRLVDRFGVKGKRGAIEVYEIIWKEEDMTNVVGDLFTEAVADPDNPPCLLLSYQGREIHMDGRRPFLLLGRSPSCDVVVEDKLVSRVHVRIEMRRGKFYLIDHSSNGTYLESDQGDELILRREETTLPGRGRLSLGRSLRESTVEVVHFEVPTGSAA